MLINVMLLIINTITSTKQDKITSSVFNIRTKSNAKRTDTCNIALGYIIITRESSVIR